MTVRGKSIYIVLMLAALMVVAVSSDVFADVYGKISGTVIDKKTKDPIIGCAIQIEGTTLGALTDPDGSFRILSVPAGVQVVLVQMSGIIRSNFPTSRSRRD